VFLLLVRSAWDAPFPATRPLWLGLGFLAAAVAIRVAAGALKFDGDVVPGDIRTLGVAIHQGAELGGWILVATGLVAFAAVREPATASRPSGGGRPSP
jgi:hypothetical protein